MCFYYYPEVMVEVMVDVDRRRGIRGRRGVQRPTGGDHLDTAGLREGLFRQFLGFVGVAPSRQ